mmetsp:Transcript_27449/g.80743  ORF Transcript_27449/g.80743 Transcript_27449/m.80743 type:complete len:202 (+) Transcript_27449:1852-2457(+)
MVAVFLCRGLRRLRSYISSRYRVVVRTTLAELPVQPRRRTVGHRRASRRSRRPPCGSSPRQSWPQWHGPVVPLGHEVTIYVREELLRVGRARRAVRLHVAQVLLDVSGGDGTDAARDARPDRPGRHAPREEGRVEGGLPGWSVVVRAGASRAAGTARAGAALGAVRPSAAGGAGVGSGGGVPDANVGGVRRTASAAGRHFF